MDVRTYIQQQMVEMNDFVAAAINDVTEEQFNWVPPGTVSPISAILLHTLSAEDYFIQEVLQGRTRIWDEQGWLGKIGVQAPGGPGADWSVFKTTRIALAPVLAYGQLLRPATDAYLVALTAEELDRQVKFGKAMHPAASVLVRLIVHTASHAGEIAAVKGMQGFKGLPF
jgi:hypothetical protein